MLERVVSGGQTGVDRAALDAALESGLAIGGWCPRGRRAEDGLVPGRFPLVETPGEDPAQRTAWNVRDADATLALVRREAHGGTALAIERARRVGRPLLVVDLEAEALPAEDIARWLARSRARVLNVAGPRESEAPGIEAAARALLREVFGLVERRIPAGKPEGPSR